MADDWHAPVQRAANYVVTPGNWNEVQDNLEALYSGLVGDAQATDEVTHRHKVGTLAALPAAGKAGRIYIPSDIVPLSVMVDDGSDWRGSMVVHDTFNRANSSDLTANGGCDSGHTWTEQVGDLDINTNHVEVVAAAAASIATVDTKMLLDDAYVVAEIDLYTAAADGDIDTSIILRYLDATHYLYVQYIGGATDGLRIMNENAGSNVLGTVLWTPAVGVSYTLRAIMAGSYVRAEVFRRSLTDGSNIITLDHAVIADTRTPFLGATELGFRIAHDDADQVGAFVAKVQA